MLLIKFAGTIFIIVSFSVTKLFIMSNTLARQENLVQWETIKSDSKYYWGEGSGNTVEAAKNAASADLIKKIWVAISVNTNSKTIEKQQGKNLELASEWTENIASFSTFSLTDLKYILKKEAKSFHVLAYITVENIINT